MQVLKFIFRIHLHGICSNLHSI
uniref:Uncharacterized protein n=1 Tax=Anguilla anguilla TaxID=7936 RepID=A0A0E9SHG9_ANGAN